MGFGDRGGFGWPAIAPGTVLRVVGVAPADRGDRRSTGACGHQSRLRALLPKAGLTGSQPNGPRPPTASPSLLTVFLSKLSASAQCHFS